MTRAKIKSFVQTSLFRNFITILILINAVTLGMETNKDIIEELHQKLVMFDKAILSVFVVEILLKLYAYRLSFFKKGWNVFDFVIVGVSLLPATGPFAILRAFRIFRVLRLMSVVPQMRRVVTALIVSLPGMTSIVAVLSVIFYVSAVLVTKLFGAHPDPMMQELYGSIGASMYTLFQVMTLEGWADMAANPTLEFFPKALFFYVPFIVITSFAVLNLFIGIIVDAMNIVQEQDLEDEKQSLEKEIGDLKKSIADLHRDVKDIKNS